MNINSDDPRLTALALGELDGAERTEIAAQVAACVALEIPVSITVNVINAIEFRSMVFVRQSSDWSLL